MFYIVCGEYQNFKYPAFYVSKESNLQVKTRDWKFGLLAERAKANDIWYFGSFEEAQLVALQLAADKGFKQADTLRKNPQVVQLKTKTN